MINDMPIWIKIMDIIGSSKSLSVPELTDPDKFLLAIRACYQDNGDANHLLRRNQRRIRSACLEHELMRANWYRPSRHLVQFYI